MFIALACLEESELAPPPPVPSNDLFLSPTFVQSLATELAGPCPQFALQANPLLRGGRTGQARQSARRTRHRPRTHTEGRDVSGELIPAGGGLRAQVQLRCSSTSITDCSGGILGASRRGSWCGVSPSGWVRIATSLIRALVPDVPALRHTKAEHSGSRELLHPLPPRRGGMIEVYWIVGLPTTTAGFDIIQNHVDLQPKHPRHAVPTRCVALDDDEDAAQDGRCADHSRYVPAILRRVPRRARGAFVKSTGSCLVVGSAYHKNTNAKVERTNGVISDTLRAYANGRKDD